MNVPQVSTSFEPIHEMLYIGQVPTVLKTAIKLKIFERAGGRSAERSGACPANRIG